MNKVKQYGIYKANITGNVFITMNVFYIFLWKRVRKGKKYFVLILCIIHNIHRNYMKLQECLFGCQRRFGFVTKENMLLLILYIKHTIHRNYMNVHLVAKGSLVLSLSVTSSPMRHKLLWVQLCNVSRQFILARATRIWCAKWCRGFIGARTLPLNFGG